MAGRPGTHRGGRGVNAFHYALFGGLPANANRQTLLWLWRQHMARARLGRRHSLELSVAGHLNEAARCRRSLHRIPNPKES